MPPARNLTVDVVRGVAILIMVPANMASVYVEPHAFWFRVVSSFAAPTFIIVAGMMIAQGAAARDHDWVHYLVRAALLLVMAALVDTLIFKVLPFQSFDVLHVIAFACALTYFFTRLPRALQWMLIALIFLATPLLQWVFGYTDHPGEYILWGSNAGQQETVPKNPTSVLQHLFIDGWFPIFPWLGMSFVGVMMAPIVFGPEGEEAYNRMALVGAITLVVGVIAWMMYPGPAYVRDGYSELFYPPTIGFILTACGFVPLLLWTMHWAPGWPIFAPLRWIGECALLMYVLHLAIISYLIEPQISEKRLPAFLVISFVTIFVLAILAFGVRQLKAAWPNRPFLARFLLG